VSESFDIKEQTVRRLVHNLNQQEETAQTQQQVKHRHVRKLDFI
jgi:hypothetical protein